MTKNSHFDRRLYINRGYKATETDEILHKYMYVVVDRKHKPICHQSGHLLIFYRRKDAFAWLFDNLIGDEADPSWRIQKLNIKLEDK